MPWLVVFMTVIFPFLLLVLVVMDLVEFETKAVESPLSRREHRTVSPQSDRVTLAGHPSKEGQPMTNRSRPLGTTSIEQFADEFAAAFRASPRK